MSTPETTETSAPANTLYCTLVRGRVYYLGDREFMNGVEQEITEEVREWLEEHAIDLVSVEDEYEHQERQKFVFREGPKVEAVQEVAPTRARRRA
jgi:hypothetical protein